MRNSECGFRNSKTKTPLEQSAERSFLLLFIPLTILETFHRDILKTDMDNSERFDPRKFMFRGLHSQIRIGMASDR